MNIDIKDFLTAEHTKIIQDKITESLNTISIEEIKIQITKNIDFTDIGEYISDNIDYDPFVRFFNNIIKEKANQLKIK